jgi:hypothetical protein
MSVLWQLFDVAETKVNQGEESDHGDKMRHALFVVCALFLTACGSRNTQTSAPSETTAPKAAIANVDPTETPVPTATIDYQATSDFAQQQVDQAKQDAYQSQQDAIQAQQAAVNAQQTSIAAGVAIAQITQQAEANQMTIVWITQESSNIIETHVAETQTAQPTALAILSTQQTIQNQQMILQSGQLTATKEAPALLQKMSDAQNAAKYGWINYVAIGLVSSVACLLMVWVMMYLNQKPIQKIEIADLNDDYIIPLRDVSETKQVRIHTDVPCTIKQLLEFADGICNRGMTLAIKQWEGTIVHKRIVDNALRSFMVSNGFAKVIPSKGGELIVTQAGEEFLQSCLVLQTPPPPYEVVEFDAPVISQLREMPVKGGGGVVGGHLGMLGKEFTSGTDN